MASPNKLTVAPDDPTITIPIALLERLTVALERQAPVALSTAVAEDAKVLAALHGLTEQAAAQIEWFVAAAARAQAALAALAPDSGEVPEPDVGVLLADAIKAARPAAPAPSELTRGGLEGLLAGLMAGK